MTFKYKHKKNPNVQNPTERGEENQVRRRERIHAVQSHCQASLWRLVTLVPTTPWWFRRTIQSGYVFPLPSPNHLSSSIRCRPKPQATNSDPFWCLCFCFGMGFGVCVCISLWVLAWISGWVSGFVCILGLCFGRGFRPLSVVRAGFLLVVLNLLVSIWVAHISTLFFFVFLIWVLLIFLLVFSGFFDNFFFVLLHWFLMGCVAVVWWFPD